MMGLVDSRKTKGQGLTTSTDKDKEITVMEVARKFYAGNGADFDKLLMWHFAGGWVINVPYLFGMGYFYKEDDEVILHVTFVTGDMNHLLNYSFHNVIDKIEFERNCNGKPKRYDYNKFVKRVRNG